MEMKLEQAALQRINPVFFQKQQSSVLSWNLS